METRRGGRGRVDAMNILVIQTAFLGDVLLTLPTIQALRSAYPDAGLDVMVTPLAAGLLEAHPGIREVIPFDKRGKQKGIRALLALGKDLRARRYDLVMSPHKSLRTGILVQMSGAEQRIGFSDSAVRSVFTRTVAFDPKLHEIDRNLRLLSTIGVPYSNTARPELHPPEKDVREVRELLRSRGVQTEALIGIAPGSVWYTKRWPSSAFAELVRALESAGWTCALVGAEEDRPACDEILKRAGTRRAFSVAGEFRLLQSAVLIGMCRFLVSNDSAPMHIGVAMGTAVVAIFGPTLPSFGFAPRGERDRVFETHGLTCRPCSQHGGDACPVRTFDCMHRILPESIAGFIGRP